MEVSIPEFLVSMGYTNEQVAAVVNEPSIRTVDAALDFLSSGITPSTSATTRPLQTAADLNFLEAKLVLVVRTDLGMSVGKVCC